MGPELAPWAVSPALRTCFCPTGHCSQASCLSQHLPNAWTGVPWRLSGITSIWPAAHDSFSLVALISCQPFLGWRVFLLPYEALCRPAVQPALCCLGGLVGDFRGHLSHPRWEDVSYARSSGTKPLRAAGCGGLFGRRQSWSLKMLNELLTFQTWVHSPQEFRSRGLLTNGKDLPSWEWLGPRADCPVGRTELSSWPLTLPVVQRGWQSPWKPRRITQQNVPDNRCAGTGVADRHVPSFEYCGR